MPTMRLVPRTGSRSPAAREPGRAAYPLPDTEWIYSLLRAAARRLNVMETDPEKLMSWYGRSTAKLQEDGARLIILPRRQLPRALHQGSDDHGQQQLQRLAFGRRLTQQVAAGARSTSASGTSPPIRGGE